MKSNDWRHKNVARYTPGNTKILYFFNCLLDGMHTRELMQKYVVLQVTLKEKLIGTASKNLSELEDVINKQADKGYRLHTISTTSGGSKGLGGGDRIQATMVFERIE